jgi:hypothetical protein
MKLPGRWKLVKNEEALHVAAELGEKPKYQVAVSEHGRLPLLQGVMLNR